MRPWFLSHVPSHPRVPQQTHKDTNGHLLSSKNHGDVYQLRHEPALNSGESAPAGVCHGTPVPGLVRPNHWKPVAISLVLGTQGNSTVTLRTLATRMGRKCMSWGGHEDLMRRYIRHSLLAHRRELHSLLPLLKSFVQFWANQNWSNKIMRTIQIPLFSPIINWNDEIV